MSCLAKACALSSVALVYCGSVDPLPDNSSKISAASMVEVSMPATVAATGPFCTLLLWVLLPELTVLEMLSSFTVSIFVILLGGEGFPCTIRRRGSTSCGPGKLPILHKVIELKKRRSTGFCSEHKSPFKRKYLQ